MKMRDFDLLLFAQGRLSAPRRWLAYARLRLNSRTQKETEAFAKSSTAFAAMFSNEQPEIAAIRFAARRKALVWKDSQLLLLLVLTGVATALWLAPVLSKACGGAAVSVPRSSSVVVAKGHGC